MSLCLLLVNYPQQEPLIENRKIYLIFKYLTYRDPLEWPQAHFNRHLLKFLYLWHIEAGHNWDVYSNIQTINSRKWKHTTTEHLILVFVWEWGYDNNWSYMQLCWSLVHYIYAYCWNVNPWGPQFEQWCDLGFVLLALLRPGWRLFFFFFLEEIILISCL